MTAFLDIDSFNEDAGLESLYLSIAISRNFDFEPPPISGMGIEAAELE